MTSKEITSYKLVVKCCYFLFLFLGYIAALQRKQLHTWHIVVFVQFVGEKEEDNNNA